MRWHLQRMQEEGVLRIRRTADGGHEAVLHPQVRLLSEGRVDAVWLPGR